MAIPNPCRVAVLATHPIHYQIQLYRRLAQVPGIDVTMLFCSRFGLSRQIDHTFGMAHRWYDESILNGCRHKFLGNYSWEKSPSTVVDVSLHIGSRSREFYLHYGILTDRLVLSPYAVDNEFFMAQANRLKSQKRELLKFMGVSTGVPVILYVSKMTPRKRPLDLR